jgi:sterol desaturase/sphingolipid hydroxylase (fatty acid hydroxylase superfamily)
MWWKQMWTRGTPLWIGLAAAVFAYAAACVAPHAGWVTEEIGPGMIALFGLSEAWGYFLWSGGAFVLAWLLLGPFMAHRRLSRRRWPQLAQVLREIVWSLSAQAVFIAVALWMAVTDPWGAGNAYETVEGVGGWLWWGVIVFAVLVVDDTYFYWTHRLLHHPRLFDRVHRVHHESVDPTPFTAFSFHPLEALVHGVGSLSILVVALTLPWHWTAFAAAGTLQMLFNVIGHLGWEVYPRGWNRLPLLRWKTPTLHHYMHHQRVGGNYGLYFRWWDRICGTEFRDFELRYDAIFDRAGKRDLGWPQAEGGRPEPR